MPPTSTTASRCHRALTRATRNPDVTEDVLHEAYLRLLLEARAGRLPDNVPAWLYRVSMNLVIDDARRRGRLAGDATACAAREATARAAGDDPEAAVIDRERCLALRDALAELPPETRAALYMTGAGYGPREVAAHIGRSSGATRVLLCRARQRTRARLEEQLA